MRKSTSTESKNFDMQCKSKLHGNIINILVIGIDYSDAQRKVEEVLGLEWIVG